MANYIVARKPFLHTGSLVAVFVVVGGRMSITKYTLFFSTAWGLIQLAAQCSKYCLYKCNIG